MNHMSSIRFLYISTLRKWNMVLFRYVMCLILSNTRRCMDKHFVFISEQFQHQEIWWLKDLSKSNVKFILKTFYCIEHPKKRSLVKKTLIWHQIWLTDWYVWHSYLKAIFSDLISYFYVKQYFVVFEHHQPSIP